MIGKLEHPSSQNGNKKMPMKSEHARPTRVNDRAGCYRRPFGTARLGTARPGRDGTSAILLLCSVQSVRRLPPCIMDIPALIAQVQNFPELYDANHHDYFNNARREVVWEQIGAAIKQPSTDCKERWAKVRDNHRKALKRRRSRCRMPGATNSKPPRYFQELAFLASHLLDDTPPAPASGSDDSEDKQHDIEAAMEIINGNDNDETQSRSDTNIPTFNLWDLALSQTDAPPAKRTRLELRDEVVTNVLEDYLARKSSDVPTEDSLTTFFVSMAKTVHTFPIADQIEMKRKVFQLISDREMEVALRRGKDTKKPKREENIGQ
ncbi:transcription factor Adf-1-like [Nilaparvata lugens]|uniref:transcription factor Adf-1-like n=1 Tax=Nilaparvata lugens TaxID=108931 RepID=UPI00193C9677|nr:transcription factor Adf-1-like [Nilaparvata lugens]